MIIIIYSVTIIFELYQARRVYRVSTSNYSCQLRSESFSLVNRDKHFRKGAKSVNNILSNVGGGGVAPWWGGGEALHTLKKYSVV